MRASVENYLLETYVHFLLGTRYQEINRNVTRYLRKYGDDFPDYPTVLSIIEESDRTAALQLSEDQISKMGISCPLDESLI